MNDLLVPEGSLLLHIGPLKTGSTAIQQAMHQARDQLAEHGVFYPGPFHPPPAWRPSAATDAVMGRPPGIGRPTPRMEWWDQLVMDLATNPLPRACVSNEVFGRATEATGLARIAADLGRGASTGAQLQCRGRVCTWTSSGIWPTDWQASRRYGT